jgi:adenylate kinase
LIIVGHLAPYVVEKEKVDLVCVLRRSPYEIIKTFEQRKYSPEKIRENTAGEILGITLYDSIKHFGKNKVSEFDATGNTPEQTADQIMSTLDNRLGRNSGIVDWLGLVAERGDLDRFLEYS